MSHEADIRYRINDRDEIIFVNAAWDRFAEANDGAELVADRILGRNLWEFIDDPVTLQLYRQIVGRVREGRQARFHLRCDSPSRKRHLEMTICSQGAKVIEFATHCLRIEDRPAQDVLARWTSRSTEVLRACAWCNRIDVGTEAWMEVEDAAGHLKLFEAGRVPNLTHGICATCLATMEDILNGLNASA